VDVEPEMITVAERAARSQRITNVEWRLARAEVLELPAESVELMTIGEAFHRLDQQRVLHSAGTTLKRGGAIATLGGETVWRGPEPWKRVLVDVVNEWTNGALGDPNLPIWGGPIDALSAAGYRVEEHEIAENRTWTCDSIVGFMYSTSIASTRVLGQHAAAFEAHLRAALLACEPSGRFASRQRFGFTLGVRHQ
jgi:hypothetical protein